MNVEKEEMKEESFFDLISQAAEMLLDRPKDEANLIYQIAKMEPDLRSAIVIAYQEIYKDE